MNTFSVVVGSHCYLVYAKCEVSAIATLVDGSTNLFSPHFWHCFVLGDLVWETETVLVNDHPYSCKDAWDFLCMLESQEDYLDGLGFIVARLSVN